MSAASDLSEFINVSQFFEVVLGLSFFICVATQYLILRFELWRHVEKQHSENQEQYQNWVFQKSGEGKSAAPPEMTEVEKQISDIESKGQKKVENPTQMQNEESMGLLLSLSDEQKRYMSLYRQINVIFNEYFAVIFCTLIFGIITGTTLIFALAMFFCYLFSATIFNYMKLYDRLKTQYKNQTFRPFTGMMSSIFVMGLFISYFIRTEYFGA